VLSKKSASRISAELLQREKKAPNFHIQMDKVSFPHKFFANGVIFSTTQYIGENFEYLLSIVTFFYCGRNFFGQVSRKI
jgi:hypothetical protein